MVIGNWRASSSDIALGIQNSVDIFRGGYQVGNEVSMLHTPLRPQVSHVLSLDVVAVKVAIANPNTQTGPNGGIWFFVVVFDKWLVRNDLSRTKSCTITTLFLLTQRSVLPTPYLLALQWLTLFLAAVGITPFIYFSELDYRRRGLGKSRFPSSLAPGE